VARRAVCSLGFSTLVLLSACGSSSEPGVEVRLVSSPAALSSGEQLDSVPGQRLSVTEVQWTSVAVELLPCPSAARWLSEALVRTAHAHGASTPTRLAVPTIESASSVADVVLGTLRPPAERYCQVRYLVGAADEDAVGIDEAPEMAHHSVLARGFDLSSGAPAEFEIGGQLAFEVLAPVELDVSHGEHLTVRIERDRAVWFDGVDLSILDEAERARRLAENLRGSVAIRIDPP
jgi:hypothetical protein